MPIRPPAQLRIDLLGGFQVAGSAGAVQDGRWRLRKAQALLKLLALTPGHCLHREQALETLWPDRDAAAAANNLRQALFVARRALDTCGDDGAGRLGLSRELLTLADDGLRIDVEEFEAAAGQAERAPSLDCLHAALRLYGGDLLPEDRFESWTTARREALRDRHLNLLVRLAERHQVAGDDAAAVAALQQGLGVEPLYEPAHRELMLVYAHSGRRHRALEQFHLLRDALQAEFADEPDDETRLLYRQILTRDLPSLDRGQRSNGDDAPPVPAPAGNLSPHLTSFVGRERERGDVVHLTRRHRLVSLTGPGGCGKTRLALAVASDLALEQAHGAWLVELAGLTEEALVAYTIGEALGVESRSPRASEEAVAAHIGDREMLLVLDNCEHLIGRCALVTEGLLGACPSLTILATSREPLHVAGELDWRVPSLAAAEAIRLFGERAAAASSRFELTESLPAVREICRRLDGMPLAIELAAARVGVLAPPQIAERLRDSLAVLAGGSRTALTRQQTLGATIDWSHDLLDDEERRLFRRLGAFAGSFDLDAVERVCDGKLDVFARLVDKSLVMVEEQDDEARYRLLETVRHYARERLREAGEQEAMQARHQRHYLDVAQALEPVMDRAATRRRLSRDTAELREALRTALLEDPELALALAATVWRFWDDRGDRSEGAGWLAEALTACPDPSWDRARALHGLSILSMRMGDNRRALATVNEAVRFHRSGSERRPLADELHHLATMSWVFSDYASALRLCEESLQLAEAAEDPAAVAAIVHTQGVIAASRHQAEGRGMIARSIELLGELGEDEQLLLPVAHGYGRFPGPPHRVFLEQTFVTARRVAPPGAVAYALCDLACAERDMGDPAAARARLEDSLLQFRQLGDDLGAAQALGQLGNLLAAAGEHGLAQELHDESLGLRKAANEARGIGLSLLAIGTAASCRGDHARAAESAAEALALFDRTGDQPGRGGAVTQLGYAAADTGQLGEARGLQERALSLWSSFISKSGWVPGILLELAQLDIGLGEPERARDRFHAALDVARYIGDDVVITRCEAGLANTPLTLG